VRADIGILMWLIEIADTRAREDPAPAASARVAKLSARN
jgi:hypothetical protein